MLFYIIFLAFGGVAYVFYIAMLAPLYILSQLSDNYYEEYKESYFSLKLLLEEEENTTGRVCDEETAQHEAQGVDSPSKQNWVAPDIEETRGPDSVEAFAAPER